MNKTMISVSLVIYCNKTEELTRAIKSALSSKLVGKIYLIDNSINNELKILENLDVERIEYFFQNKNLGFGTGYYIAIKESLSLGYSYHIVINPYIYFDGNINYTMFNYMNSDIGIMELELLHLTGHRVKLKKHKFKSLCQKQEKRMIPALKRRHSSIYQGFPAQKYLNAV